MAEALTLEYNELPAAAPGYVKALLSKGGRLQEGETIPRIEANIRKVTVDAGKLASYRKVCGFPETGHLPVSYPHVLAFPLHLDIMTRKEFPLKLLGLVHVRNSITQHKAIGVSDAMDIRVYVDGHRDAEKGLEFDLVTEVYGGTGELLWESTSTMLSRGKSNGGGGKKKRQKKERPLESGQHVSFQAEAGIGRSYARVAGDVNPIHLSSLSAKLFGFPKAIAHGMWLLAKSAAELHDELPREGFRYDVSFKLPVLLPARVLLRYSASAKGVDMSLLNKDGEKPHMAGSVTFLQ